MHKKGYDSKIVDTLQVWTLKMPLKIKVCIYIVLYPTCWIDERLDKKKIVAKEKLQSFCTVLQGQNIKVNICSFAWGYKDDFFHIVLKQTYVKLNRPSTFKLQSTLKFQQNYKLNIANQNHLILKNVSPQKINSYTPRGMTSHHIRDL